jgi:hypothetical protein
MILCGYFLHYAITCPKSMLVVVFRIRNKGTGYYLHFAHKLVTISIINIRKLQTSTYILDSYCSKIPWWRGWRVSYTLYQTLYHTIPSYHTFYHSIILYIFYQFLERQVPIMIFLRTAFVIRVRLVLLIPMPCSKCQTLRWSAVYILFVSA